MAAFSKSFGKSVARTVALGAWLAGLSAGVVAPAAVAEENTRGRELFELCQQCHGANAGGNPLTLAPSIAGLQQWYVERQLTGFKAGYRGQEFHDIAGMRMRPMARWLKTDDDVKAVAAYVSSLPPVRPAPTLVGGDAAKGQAFYAPCTACHGPDGSGNQLLNAPALNHASDWYLLTQLRNFKAGIRGTNAGDSFGKIMQPMSMTLPDEQAMKDVIAYITTLSAKTASAQ